MNISTYLKEERICLNLEATEKKAAIRELAGFLRGSKEVTNFNSFLKDVFKREKVGTTGIGNGIAIPHARTDAVSEFVIAFGRSAKGVEFQSLDSKPVKLVFLMGAPKQNINGYLRILARLTRLLKKWEFRKSFMEASSAREIIEIFEKTEE
ncbi:PTS sugar transporter subunit IIA [candidate division WOR-3 bacterium]|nr:PTS sugar transporter subunit IIA [candidate division WOR-3 bacterium]